MLLLILDSWLLQKKGRCAISRQIFINGESLVLVKGRSDSAIPTITQLGLADSPIIVNLETKYDDVMVDAWGQEVPMDVQMFLTEARVSMTLVHFDPAVLRACLALTMGFPINEGEVARAGTLMGGNVPLLTPGNNFISLNIVSPVAGLPWRFRASFLTGPTADWPLGTKRSLVRLNWRVIPYPPNNPPDPYGGGTGSLNVPLYDHTLDS